MQKTAADRNPFLVKRLSGLVTKRASADAVETAQGLRFTLSTDDTDLMGDVVEQSGLTPAYTPLPAMIDHGVGMAELVGKWVNLRNEGKSTTGDLELLPAGISPAADLIRAIRKAGIRLGVSVKFLPEEAEPIRSPAKGRAASGVVTGIRYLRAKLVEASIVAQPCNPQAFELVGKRLTSTQRAALDRLVHPLQAQQTERLAKAAAAAKRLTALLS